MTQNALPRRASEVLDFIRDTITSDRYSPSVREIGEALGLKSPSNVHRYLNLLEEQGFISRADNSARSIQLPGEEPGGLRLAGIVPAGQPIQVFEQDERFDLGGLYDSDDFFGLRVQGESMIEASILDGDIVVLRKQHRCENGQIVSAMIDEDEVTLKRYFKERGTIRLEPANSRMKTIYPTRIAIQGVAVGVIRTAM